MNHQGGTIPIMTTRSFHDLPALLAGVSTIAVAGVSADPARASNEVLAFLVARGYACVGVNPGLAGRSVHGAPVFATLADIDRPVDMVDVFRASDALPALVEEVLAMAPRPRVLWTQLGVVDAAAGARAEGAGLIVVMDRCPKIVLGGH